MAPVNSRGTLALPKVLDERATAYREPTTRVVVVRVWGGGSPMSGEEINRGRSLCASELNTAARIKQWERNNHGAIYTGWTTTKPTAGLRWRR